MADLASSWLPIPVWTAAALVVATSLCFYRIMHKRTHDDNDDLTIPWAPGKIPVLGHALAYQANPPQFLIDSCQAVGPVFQVNLAGKHMIIVAGGPNEQEQIAKAPERLLSAKQAVANIGFEVTLGSLSVHQGTDFHKRLLKGAWSKNKNAQIKAWKTALSEALKVEVTRAGATTTVSFFPLLRRTFLRAVLAHMVSPHFLKDDDTDNKGDPFLHDYMLFQDALEDATAKSVVLPRWIAYPFFLRPVQRQRERLEQDLVRRLEELATLNEGSSSSAPLGFWFQGMIDNNNNNHNDNENQSSFADIANYLVGLLFAAHKNPSIAAGQAFLFLHEKCSQADQRRIHDESQTFLEEDCNNNDDDDVPRKCPTLRKLTLETLRLTAHSIGAVRVVQEQDFCLTVLMGERDTDTDTQSDTKKQQRRQHQTHMIPQGSTISLSHIAPSLRAKDWGDDAKELNLQEHDSSLYEDAYRFTTFSHGVHQCPGQTVALLLIESLVATLLQDYNVELPKTTLPPLSFERATLAQREGPVMVKIQPNAQ